MKTVLFTLALLAQMAVQAAVPDRSVGTTASADTPTDTHIAARSAKGVKGTKGATDTR